MKMARPAVPLQHLRALTLQKPTASGRPAFLSAASGLVIHGDKFYVVADDELHLGIFSADMREHGAILPLLQGELPPEKAARKKAKPDFETLTYLPATASQPHGALLALGSGSRANRALGVQLQFDAAANLDGGVPAPLDCAPLYAELEREFGIVNIEGAIVQHGKLLLLQRGNKKAGVNAIVYLDLEVFRRGCADAIIDATALLDIRNYELGSVDGVALGFTDATCLPDGELLALAVAEDTDDPYSDGATLGSYLCRFDRHNELQSLTALHVPEKTEGIALWLNSPTAKPLLVFVTDADDAAIPAGLFTAPLAAFQ